MHNLLFGKNGQIGWVLECSLSPLCRITAVDFYSTDYCGDFSKPAVGGRNGTFGQAERDC